MGHAIKLRASTGSKFCFDRVNFIVDSSLFIRYSGARIGVGDQPSGNAVACASSAFADACQARKQAHCHCIKIVPQAASKRTGSSVFKDMLLALKIPVQVGWADDAGRDIALAAHQSHFLAQGSVKITEGTSVIAFAITGKIDSGLQFLNEIGKKLYGLVAQTQQLKVPGHKKPIGPAKSCFGGCDDIPAVNPIDHVIRHNVVALGDVTLAGGTSAPDFAVST